MGGALLDQRRLKRLNMRVQCVSLNQILAGGQDSYKAFWGQLWKTEYRVNIGDIKELLISSGVTVGCGLQENVLRRLILKYLG